MTYFTPDFGREKRRGFPEAIYAEGKTPEQVFGIAEAMLAGGMPLVLITRLSAEYAAKVSKRLPALKYYETARIGVIGEFPEPAGKIVVAAAGTSDLPVAEEAAVTAEALGNGVERVYDVGVAGIQRLLAKADVFKGAGAIISVAGMEGALTSVIAGLTDCPVIGVPTSVGYGANFGGVSALLSMLNSCAGGIGVVNIDNGYGAAVLASMINKLIIKNE